MEKAYKFRLYPNAEQAQLLQRTFGCCRFIFNRYLAMRIHAYQQDGTTLSYNDCAADMTLLKKELGWLCEVDATALQSSLRDLDRAYQNFFRRAKRGEKSGFPRFKSKHSHRKSCTSKLVRNNIALVAGGVKLPKLGVVSAAISKQVEGRILSATVSQAPSGKYFVALCCTEVEIEQDTSTGAAIGLDLGQEEFVIDSDGRQYPNHKYLSKGQKQLARLQRQLSRKTKGSRNREKARIRAARCLERITNQRNDTLHKLSSELVKNYDVICMEDLQAKNMAKSRESATSLADAAWSEFTRQLVYKCEWQHKALVKVSYSQLCSEEGLQRNHDTKAAQHILAEGLRLLGA